MDSQEDAEQKASPSTQYEACGVLIKQEIDFDDTESDKSTEYDASVLYSQAGCVLVKQEVKSNEILVPTMVKYEASELFSEASVLIKHEKCDSSRHIDLSSETDCEVDVEVDSTDVKQELSSPSPEHWVRTKNVTFKTSVLVKFC